MRWLRASVWGLGFLTIYGCSADTPDESAKRGVVMAGAAAQAAAGAASAGRGPIGPTSPPTAAGTVAGPTAGAPPTTLPTSMPGAGMTGSVAGAGVAGISMPRAGANAAGMVAPAVAGGGGAAGGTTMQDPNAKKPPPEKLPQVKGTCPSLADGTVMVAGSTVVLWAGSKPGPAYFYFHGTGTSPGEVDQGFPGATLGVRTNGGLVASWSGSNGMGTNTGTIWYTGDLDAMDQLVACGVQKGIIDTARIHVAGYSAGGLETGAAIFSRSNYVASGIVYSGGKPFGAGNLQDPKNVPSVLGAHGAKGSDALGLDFHDGTIALGKEIVRLGGFAIDCDDNMDHIVGWFTRAGVGGKAMQFLADHPYNTKPYAGALPAGYPSYCTIVK